MADEEKTKLRLEIAHVLFMDIVGYSRRLVDEQSEALHELNTLVLHTEAAQEAEAAGRLIRLPTGDGMALVFTSSVEAPVECALQISQALRAQPSLPLRMGIHSGPVQHFTDVNGRVNIAGAGINIAQRVMDCGDAGHILVSKRVADDLAGSRRWQPYLHELGDAEVKHGMVVSLVNLYADVVGNPTAPAKFGGAGAGRRKLVPVGARTGMSRGLLGGSALLLVAALAFAGWQWIAAGRRAAPMAAAPAPFAGPAAGASSPVPAAALEKSIAVLPFESLSDDKSNAYFAEGIQDEILTDLAKVADLKVISRTSVTAYDAGHARNVREIGVALGVAHLLEGSVQRVGSKVRVNAQLIDARTDVHQWAEHYDRPLDDVFAIQSEIARAIADQLQAKISPVEKAAIDAKPTVDPAAYDLYVQAKDLVASYQRTASWRDTLLRAVRLLDDATARDPAFALAYCLAARAHDQLYFFDLDPTPARLALETNAVADALRLQPGLGEAHLARALLLYHGLRDYDGARRELAVARAGLPNDAEVFSVTSYLDRRAGRWPEAAANQDRARSLDPLSQSILNDQMVLHDMRHEYADEIRVAEAGAQAVPTAADFFRLTAAQALLEGGRTAAARAQLDALPAGYDPDGTATYTRVCVALYDRRPAEAAALVAAFAGGDYPGVNGVRTPRAWLLALVARAAGDEARAQAALLEARGIADANVRQRPDDPAALALLGQIDAGLGRKADALREGRHAVAMRPISVDAMDGPGLETALAMIDAWTGEADAAMERLSVLATTPGGPDYGQLRFDPAWDVLRGRAGFQAMLTRLDPHLGP